MYEAGEQGPSEAGQGDCAGAAQCPDDADGGRLARSAFAVSRCNATSVAAVGKGLPLALTIGPKYSFSHTTTRTLGGKSRIIEASPFIVSSVAGPPVTTTCTTGWRPASGSLRTVSVFSEEPLAIVRPFVPRDSKVGRSARYLPVGTADQSPVQAVG